MGASALAGLHPGQSKGNTQFHEPAKQSAPVPTTRPATQPTTEPATRLDQGVITKTPGYRPATRPAEGNEATDVGNYIAKNEGWRNKVYDDGKGFNTIGIGHKLIDSDRELFKKLFDNKVDFDKINAGQAALSDEQILTLFANDYQDHRQRTKRLFPDFDDYPNYVKAALVDGVFRGDLSGSPTTRRFINQGEWDQAATEYLNNNEYRTADANGLSGIPRRMERNRDAMIRYGQEVKRKHDPDFE